MGYSRLTDEQKAINSGIFPSGEGMFFDDAKQSINTRYQRGLEGGLSNENSFVEKDLSVDPSAIYIGSANSGNDGTVQKSLFNANGLIFSEMVSGDINILSNASQAADTFQLINPYIHYSANPDGGVGLVDQSAFYYEYQPAYDSNVTKFFRYGEP